MEQGYTSEHEVDAVDNAIIYTAYAGDNFWGAGESEREAIENALSGHLETCGEPLDPDWIELREVRGAVAFNVIEKARLHGWLSIYDMDLIER